MTEYSLLYKIVSEVKPSIEIDEETYNAGREFKIKEEYFFFLQ